MIIEMRKGSTPYSLQYVLRKAHSQFHSIPSITPLSLWFLSASSIIMHSGPFTHVLLVALTYIKPGEVQNLHHISAFYNTVYSKHCILSPFLLLRTPLNWCPTAALVTASNILTVLQFSNFSLWKASPPPTLALSARVHDKLSSIFPSQPWRTRGAVGFSRDHFGISVDVVLQYA